MTSAAAAVAAAEDALRKYCASSLVHEYDTQMSTDQQNTLLEALLATSRSHVTQWMIHQQHQQQQQPLNSTSTSPAPANSTCPLVKAMTELGADMAALDNDGAFAYCRENLRTWGAAAAAAPSTSPVTPELQLMRYRQIVALQKASPNYHQQSSQRAAAGVMQTNQAVAKTTSGKNVDDATNNKNKSHLRRIAIRDLQLFTVSKGCYVEGTIIGEAIQPMVGGTTLLQDAAGDVILVCFYNFLPDGIRGAEAEPLLQQKLPLGAQLTVMEPFLKIFGDGQRGIRVDDPGEMHVVVMNGTAAAASSEIDSEAACVAAKQQGNDLVAQQRYYAAAEAYLAGLRTNQLVPALLSNRCQALFHIGQYVQALCDAAAALTMLTPQSKLAIKTWARYHMCLEKVVNETAKDENQEQQEDASVTKTTTTTTTTRTKLFRSLIDIFRNPQKQSTTKPADAKEGVTLKESGNDAFRKKDFEQAVEFYTLALQAGGETVRAMLSNWSLCALETMALGDVIAASVASLRIGFDEKTTLRLAKALALLGEYDLALEIIADASLTPLFDEIKQAQLVQKNILEEPDQAVAQIVDDTPNCLGNWRGPVETFLSEGKGRGLRATRDINPGEVICCEIPVVSSTISEFNVDSDRSFVTYGKDGKIDDATLSKLHSALVRRLQYDAVLSQIMDRLSDGEDDKPLVPLSDLMLNLEMFPLLLPSHRDFLPDQDVPKISSDRMKKILDINSHGYQGDVKILTGSTGLLPAISMMNHASRPNCTFAPTTTSKSNNAVHVVVACQHIQKGQELTMKYHTDEVAWSKWGIVG